MINNNNWNNHVNSNNNKELCSFSAIFSTVVTSFFRENQSKQKHYKGNNIFWLNLFHEGADSLLCQNKPVIATGFCQS